MANIYIIDRIKLDRKGMRVKDAAGIWTDLHQQQGSLDGACVVYSTIMALLTIGYIEKEDIDIWMSLDRRTKKGKFLSHLLDEQGFIRDGYSLLRLEKELSELDLEVNLDRKMHSDSLDRIADSIYSDNPVILRLVDDEMDHAVLAIGVEYLLDEGKEKVQKLLCLDPSYGMPRTAYWNCVIDTGHFYYGPLPYIYFVEGNGSRVRIKEFVTIKKKE